MTPLTIRTGDATRPTADGPKIIAHVCNDIGAWGAGFSGALSRRWPEVEREYRYWHRQGEAGNFRHSQILFVPVGGDLLVANMIAQHGIGPNRDGLRPIRYAWLTTCLFKLSAHALARNASVHMPRIGCGLAGGTWPAVAAVIEATLCQQNIPVYVYDLPGSTT